MTVTKLVAAMAEAERFLRLARELQDDGRKTFGGSFWPSRKSGAVRRASMDLTRALAELRKSR